MEEFCRTGVERTKLLAAKKVVAGGTVLSVLLCCQVGHVKISTGPDARLGEVTVCLVVGEVKVGWVEKAPHQYGGRRQNREHGETWILNPVKSGGCLLARVTFIAIRTARNTSEGSLSCIWSRRAQELVGAS